MKKRRFAKNTWYDWLFTYISAQKTVGGFKDKIMSLFKQTQPSTIVNQHMSTMCMGLERNQKKTKIKKTGDSIIKNIRNRFMLEKENKAIKNRIIKDNRNLFEQEDKYYYKQVRVGNFWNNNYIEYESKSNIIKNLSIKEYLEEFEPYFKDIINNLQKAETWKIQLKILINFVSPKDINEKSDNIEL